MVRLKKKEEIVEQIALILCFSVMTPLLKICSVVVRLAKRRLTGKIIRKREHSVSFFLLLLFFFTCVGVQSCHAQKSMREIEKPLKASEEFFDENNGVKFPRAVLSVHSLLRNGKMKHLGSVKIILCDAFCINVSCLCCIRKADVLCLMCQYEVL